MTIDVQSTTDSPEAVTAAIGNLAQTKEVKETPAKAPVSKDDAQSDDITEVIEPEPEAESQDSDETEESEDLDLDEDEKKEGPKPKKKGGFQRKLDKLNSKLSTAEQQAEYWRQEALRAKEPAKADPKPEVKPDLSTKPKADQFSTHEEYMEALTDWKVEQKFNAQKQADKENAVKNEIQNKAKAHLERVQKFSADKEDWDEIQDVFKSAPINITFQEVLLDSDYSAEMLYELGKDKKELNRILALPPIKMAKELGRLETRFTKSESSKEKPLTTKAPPPIKPVRSKGSASVLEYRDDMTQAEYNRWRAEQAKRK